MTMPHHRHADQVKSAPGYLSHDDFMSCLSDWLSVSSLVMHLWFTHGLMVLFNFSVAQALVCVLAQIFLYINAPSLENKAESSFRSVQSVLVL